MSRSNKVFTNDNINKNQKNLDATAITFLTQVKNGFQVLMMQMGIQAVTEFEENTESSSA